MTINSPAIKVTKDDITTTVIYEIAPFTMPPGRTMVPLRFIAETFGATVDWDPKTEGIHIELKKSDGQLIVIDMQLGNKIAYVMVIQLFLMLLHSQLNRREEQLSQ